MGTLSDRQIKNLKPKGKKYKVSDRDGMYIEVLPSGTKSFRYNFTVAGKQKTLTHGTYPGLSLAEARERHILAKRNLADGIDPTRQKKLERRMQAAALSKTFGAIAERWYEKRQGEGYAAATLKKDRLFIDQLKEDIGHLAIDEIKPSDLLIPIQKHEQNGARHMPHRMRAKASAIFRYAIALGFDCRDIGHDVRDAVQKRIRPQHHASIKDPARIGDLLRNIDKYGGQVRTKVGLLVLAHTFVRPIELRTATWNNIDFNNRIWTIPAEVMKMRREHLVPMSDQVCELFSELLPYKHESRFVFRGIGSKDQPFSENTLNQALRRLGYTNKEMVSHGFRSMASTLLHEQGYNSQWIEKQLAHEHRNKVMGVYNKAEYLDQRRQMMQEWSDYLSKLKDSQNS